MSYVYALKQFLTYPNECDLHSEVSNRVVMLSWVALRRAIQNHNDSVSTKSRSGFRCSLVVEVAQFNFRLNKYLQEQCVSVQTRRAYTCGFNSFYYDLLVRVCSRLNSRCSLEVHFFQSQIKYLSKNVRYCLSLQRVEFKIFTYQSFYITEKIAFTLIYQYQFTAVNFKFKMLTCYLIADKILFSEIVLQCVRYFTFAVLNAFTVIIPFFRLNF